MSIPDRENESVEVVGELPVRPIPAFQPEYITDTDGKRKGVILSLEEYQELMEDIVDLAVLAERREEPTISHEDLVADLKRNGYLPG
jgi:hypothetical protein